VYCDDGSQNTSLGSRTINLYPRKASGADAPALGVLGLVVFVISLLLLRN